MSYVKCPHCERGIKLVEKLYGRRVACKCGHEFRMPSGPVPPPEPAPVPVQTIAQRAIAFGCPSCGMQLEVDSSHAGKVSQCPCGTKIRVPMDSVPQSGLVEVPEVTPVANSSPAPPPIVSNAMMPDPLMSDPLAPPIGNAAMGNVGNPYDQADPFTDDYGLAAPDTSVSGPAYLQPTKRKKRQSDTRKRFESTQRRKAAHREDEQSASAEMIGGIAAMVGAVVWFVGGYLCGYIFFYPPVLFFIGLAGVIRGATKA